MRLVCYLKIMIKTRGASKLHTIRLLSVAKRLPRLELGSSRGNESLTFRLPEL
ncbi:MAG: hypothetical protein J6M43_05965 [Neisseriaceae bacterium]|nr:hypothetical protein [Neisseriaceae bacterium]